MLVVFVVFFFLEMLFLLKCVYICNFFLTTYLFYACKIHYYVSLIILHFCDDNIIGYLCNTNYLFIAYCHSYIE